MSRPTRSRLAAPAEAARADSAEGQAALAWAVRHGQAGALAREVAREVQRNQRRRRARLASAVCAVAVVACGLSWWMRPTVSRGPARVATAVVVSQPVTRVLPDGSVVELNPAARITVDFGTGGTGLRRVELEGGDAHFQVTKDPARPFVVVARGVEVRAVGTAFAVQLGTAAVDVLVTEGRVAVSKPEPAASDPGASRNHAAPVFVDAGQRVVIGLDPASIAAPPPVLAVSETDRAARLAWRAPRVEFTGAPLAEVIPVFNRHGDRRLVLGDPALGALLVSGLLHADNTAALLRLLEAEFGVVAESRGAETVLHRR